MSRDPHYIYARVDADTFLVTTNVASLNEGTEGGTLDRDGIAFLNDQGYPMFTAYLEGETFKPGTARVLVRQGVQKKWLQTFRNKKESDNLGQVMSIGELKNHRQRAAAKRLASRLLH